MSEPWLLLNNRKFSLEQIKGGNPVGLSAFEKNTLQFCRDWLSHQEAFTVATSGSTGVPKQINFERSQLIASARLSERALGFKSGYTALLCLDPNFIAGKMMIVRSLVTEMNIVAVEPSANPLTVIPDHLQIDFAAFVPYQMHAIISSIDGVKKLEAMKAVIVGGATPGRELIAALRQVSIPVYATYGMTETLTHIALQRLSGPDAADYFEVLPGVTITRDDRECLVIHAPHLGETKITTNDLVEVLSSSQFRWLGRWDTIINTGGVKVVPEKIEAKAELVLGGMGMTNRYFVSGWPDEQLGNKVILIMEGKPLTPSAQREILRRLQGELSRFELPREVRFIQRFVETNTQKINREATLNKLIGSV